MLTIAATALVGYILPFDNMMGIADAAVKKTDYKKARDDFKKKFDKKKEEVKTTSIRIGLAQSAVQNAGIIGGGSVGGNNEPFQQGNTAFQFLQQSQQVCSGISNCPNTQLVQFTPYTIFGQ